MSGLIKNDSPPAPSISLSESTRVFVMYAPIQVLAEKILKDLLEIEYECSNIYFNSALNNKIAPAQLS